MNDLPADDELLPIGQVCWYFPSMDHNVIMKAAFNALRWQGDTRFQVDMQSGCAYTTIGSVRALFDTEPTPIPESVLSDLWASVRQEYKPRNFVDEYGRVRPIAEQQAWWEEKKNRAAVEEERRRQYDAKQTEKWLAKQEKKRAAAQPTDVGASAEDTNEPASLSNAEALPDLTPREWAVIRARMEKKTLRRIGAEFGLSSGERIRQIEAKACRKLRYYYQHWQDRPHQLSALAWIQDQDKSPLGRGPVPTVVIKETKTIIEPQRWAGGPMFPSLSTDEEGIHRLDLSPRAYNALLRAGIRRICDLAEMPEDKILAIPNFGTHSLHAVREALLARQAHLQEKSIS